MSLKIISEPKIAALIVAGGKGTRAGSELPKQYQKIGGEHILYKTINIFNNSHLIDIIQVIVNKNDEGLYSEIAKNFDILPAVHGGIERQDSVRVGLDALAKYSPDYVLIHDAARPFADDEIIEKLANKLTNEKAAIPVMPITQTIKKAENNYIKSTIDREQVYTAQTPQAFKFELIKNLHKKYERQNFTDDAALCEEEGIKVAFIDGKRRNIKITTADDFVMAERILKAKKQTRIGQGYDVHTFDHTKNEIVICGITIPYSAGLKGHSDADVGLHALVDAMLGTIGAGDIGEHFPPSDDKWQGADSREFVTHALGLLAEAGAKIINTDITIICENPKITPHKISMKENIAKLLALETDRVSIKATTTEKLGFLGRGEGIAATAIVSVEV